MRIIPHKKFWITFSTLMVLASVIVYLSVGLNLSSDFTEGTLFAFKFHEQPTVQLKATMKNFPIAEAGQPLGGIDTKKSADGTYIMKLRRLSPEETDAVLEYITTAMGDYELLQLRNVSPVFARTFRDKAILALLVASVMIIVYITFAFRQVSRGIKSWKLGVTAIIALVHDVMIVVGIFGILGYFWQVEVDILFVTALLSVMGYSVNDTIVVFDRVRENLIMKHYAESFDEVAEKSVQQTLARSINTSFTTVLVLISLLLLGAHEIYYFVLALIIGIVVGSYSSIFLATPLLTIFQKSEK